MHPHQDPFFLTTALPFWKGNEAWAWVSKCHRLGWKGHSLGWLALLANPSSIPLTAEGLGPVTSPQSPVSLSIHRGATVVPKGNWGFQE